MTPQVAMPTFHLLERGECDALLSTHRVGRLGFTFHDRIDIEPIHYVYADGHIYGRTQVGTKVNVLAHHPWVAFEVDEVADLFVWRSVVAHGRIEFPDRDGAPSERAQYARCLEVFRHLVPAAMTAEDPTPARILFFVLHIHDLTGRAATMPGELPR
jgi:nitroimidazol reductase NimA-like FMN-containing flavoprotein (pyridoxamine 5'-phosphate oxidase superfamily)